MPRGSRWHLKSRRIRSCGSSADAPAKQPYQGQAPWPVRKKRGQARPSDRGHHGVRWESSLVEASCSPTGGAVGRRPAGHSPGEAHTIAYSNQGSLFFGRESSGRGNSGPPVCQIPQAQLGSQNLFAGEGLPARLSPTMTDIPDSLTRKRSLVQIQTAHHAKSQVNLHVIQLSQPYASRRPTFPHVPAPRPIVRWRASLRVAGGLVTVCYSTADQAMVPITTALGPQQQYAGSRSPRSAWSSSTVPNGPQAITVEGKR